MTTTLEQIRHAASLARLYAIIDAGMESSDRYVLGFVARRIEALEAGILDQIRATRDLGRLYDLMDAERSGMNRSHIIDAINIRIAKMEEIVMGLPTVAAAVGYDI